LVVHEGLANEKSARGKRIKTATREEEPTAYVGKD